MTTRALFDGDSVVLVFPDGNELSMTPEHLRGLAGLFLPIAARLLRLRKHYDDGVRFPPRVRMEARDSSGVPIAA